MNNHVIAVDIGGTNIRVALLGDKLEIVKKETAFTGDIHSKDEFFAQIEKMLQLVDSNKEAKSIGIVMPAPWTRDKKEITDITNIPCLENLKVEEIRKYFKDYSVYIENDVNVIALLESNCGAAKKYSNSLYITVSTGIGSGVIINNEIYHGAHGYAGEIGSVIVSKSFDGFSYNTLEDKCSGKALEEKSLELFGDGSDAKVLFCQYENGDKEATKVVENWIDELTSGLASVIQMFDPEVIVLGGPVVLKHNWVIDTLKHEIAKKVLGKLAREIKLVSAEFGLEAGLIGAGYYALQQEKESNI